MNQPIGPQVTNGEWVHRLASLVHELRSDWQEPGIRSALAKVADRPLADVAIAAIQAATTRTDQRTPAIIAMGGSHWGTGGGNAGNSGNSYRTPPANPPTCANCGYYEHQHQQLNNGPWRNSPCQFTRRTNYRRY